MKNVKKIIAIVVTIAMLSAMGVVAFSDVPAGTPVYEAASALSSFDVLVGFPDGTFRPTQNVTRAEMAAIITRAQGLSGISGQAQTIFTDVPATHWASGYVATATGLGVIVGHGDGTFTPDAYVTYEQVIAMVMRTIGYSPMAAGNGGFPIGYMVAASHSGVTRGITAQQTAPANRGLVARVVYNAMSTPMMIPNLWQWGGAAQYIVADGLQDRPYQTLLTHAFGVRRFVGQVIQNRYSTLLGPVDIDNSVNATWQMVVALDLGDHSTADWFGLDRPERGETEAYRFFEGDSNAGLHLGRDIIFYAVDDNVLGGYRIISAVVDAGRASEVTFDIADIDQAFNPLRVGLTTPVAAADFMMTFSRDNQRTPTTVRTNANTTVIYNGRALPSNMVFGTANGTLFGPDGTSIFGDENANGTVTAVTRRTTNNANDVDILFVNSANVFVVDTVNVNTGRVTARNHPVGMRGSVLNLDANNFNVSYNMTRDGETIGIRDLNEWDVLMIEACHIARTDANEGLFTIRVVTNTISGAITAVSGTVAAGNKRVTINGVAYELANGVYPDVNLTDVFELGFSAMFFIDENGNIAAADESRGDGVGNFFYGYIFAAVDNSGGLINRPAQVQIMLQDGRIQIADLANNVSMRNWAGEGRSINMNGDGRGSRGFYPLGDITDLDDQMIRFGINNAGAINMIELPQPSQLSASHFTELPISGSNNFEFDARRMMMTRPGASNVTVNNDAIIFFVARDGNDPDTTNSSVGTVRTLADGSELRDVRFFDQNTIGQPAVILVGDFTIESPVTNLALFDSVALMRNAEFDNIAAVTFWQNGTRTTLHTVPGAVTEAVIATGVNAFVRGTAFRFNVNANNEIDAIHKIFTAARPDVAGLLAIPTVAMHDVGTRTGPNTVIGGSWVRDDINYPSGFHVYDFAGPSGGSNIRLIYAPVNAVVGSNVIRLGRTTGTGLAWVDDFNLAVANNNTNVYMFDTTRTGAAQLAVASVGSIEAFAPVENRNMAVNGATVRFNQVDTDFPAPGLAVRDWVVVLEVDNIAVDILIVRSTARGQIFASDAPSAVYTCAVANICPDPACNLCVSGDPACTNQCPHNGNHPAPAYTCDPADLCATCNTCDSGDPACPNAAADHSAC